MDEKNSEDADHIDDDRAHSEDGSQRFKAN